METTWREEGGTRWVGCEEVGKKLVELKYPVN